METSSRELFSSFITKWFRVCKTAFPRTIPEDLVVFCVTKNVLFDTLAHVDHPRTQSEVIDCMIDYNIFWIARILLNESGAFCWTATRGTLSRAIELYESARCTFSNERREQGQFVSALTLKDLVYLAQRTDGLEHQLFYWEDAVKFIHHYCCANRMSNTVCDIVEAWSVEPEQRREALDATLVFAARYGLDNVLEVAARRFRWHVTHPQIFDELIKKNHMDCMTYLFQTGIQPRDLALKAEYEAAIAMVEMRSSVSPTPSNYAFQ